MIEVNVSPARKKTDAFKVGGVSLTELNLKGLLSAFIFLIVGGLLLESYYDDQIDDIQGEITQVDAGIKKLRSQLNKLRALRKKSDELKKLETELAKKLEAVKVVLSNKVNPYKVLKYVANNIPANVWLQEIRIQNKQFFISGYASSWKDIGVFLDNLKKSIFFGRLSYKVPDKMKNEYQGRKVEVFSIDGPITRFE